MTIPALTGDALQIAQIMYQPPNLNTLLKQPGGATAVTPDASQAEV